jgi:hypothetical protein
MAKKRINSTVKGKVGEREAVRLLEAWWGGKFSRTPASGAFMTGHKQTIIESGNDISGDVIVPHDFPFNVEIKRRNSIDLWEVIRVLTPESYDDTKNNIITWYFQSAHDAKASGRLPLVMFRENGKKWYVALPYALLKHHSVKHGYLAYKNLFYICTFDDLTLLTKETVLTIIENIKNE